MSKIEQQLAEITELLSLPEVYLKVRRLMDDANSDIHDFAGVIQVDPNLSSRVLRLVNSAYFGFPQPVDSISRAINLIGIAQLHSMVLGISAISSLKMPNEVQPLDSFWRASLFSAVLARLLAERIKLAKSDNLFVAGLLHDIGHLVLYSKFPLQALAARRIAEEQCRQLHEAEMEVLGCHYGDVGATLMANWNLSGELQSITRNHPDPDASGDYPRETALVHLARACGQIRASENGGAADKVFDAGVCALLGLTRDQIEESLDEAESISADMEKVILA